MNSSDLSAFFNGFLSPKEFSDLIVEEVANYGVLHSKNGSCISVFFNEDSDLTISDSDLKMLLNECVSNAISNIHVAYICDCLTLGEKVTFISELIEDIVFNLSEPVDNGSFISRDDICNYLNSL